MSRIICDNLKQNESGAARKEGAECYLLGLDILSSLTNLLRDEFDLDYRIRLHNAQEVLFEEGVVQRSKMGSDRRIRRKLWGFLWVRA